MTEKVKHQRKTLENDRAKKVNVITTLDKNENETNMSLDTLKTMKIKWLKYKKIVRPKQNNSR